MTAINVTNEMVPGALHGIVGCNENWIPRYWLQVWLTCHCSGSAQSTLYGKVAAISKLYDTARRVSGESLDEAIAFSDLASLRTIMLSHLQRLNNESRQRGCDLSPAWRQCALFVENILGDVVGTSSNDVGTLLADLDAFASFLRL